MNKVERNLIVCVKYPKSEVWSDVCTKYVRKVVEETEKEENGVLIITQRPTYMLVPERENATRFSENGAHAAYEKVRKSFSIRGFWLEMG